MKTYINEYAQKALNSGFRVFIAVSGNYGFITDEKGTKVVSFGLEFGGITLSGNYKTDRPSQCGTGWVIYGYKDPSKAFKDSAPDWAIRGAKWSYTTLDQYLKTYQASSKYTELKQTEGVGNE